MAKRAAKGASLEAQTSASAGREAREGEEEMSDLAKLEKRLKEAEEEIHYLKCKQMEANQNFRLRLEEAEELLAFYSMDDDSGDRARDYFEKEREKLALAREALGFIDETSKPGWVRSKTHGELCGKLERIQEAARAALSALAAKSEEKQ